MKILKSAAALIVSLSLGVSAALAGEALDRVMSNGVLTVATDSAWPPQSFLNDNNEMDGFDIDVAKAIAAKLGVEVKFVTPDWSLITAGKWAGRWDISVGSMTPTNERAKVLSFPAVYYFVPASVGVHNDSDAQTIADLKGRIFGVSSASTWEQYLRRELKIDALNVPSFEYQIEPGEIKTYGSDISQLDDLRLGDGVRIHAVIDSLPGLRAAIESGYPIRVLGDPVFYEPLAVAIDLGDDELTAKIAEIVEGMHADGTLAGLSENWFGIDYVGTNTN